MDQYIFAAYYIIIGLIGAYSHYIKKRWVDNTTNDTLIQYLQENRGFTIKSVGSIIAAEIGLSLLHQSGIITLSELLGALTAGYTADSGFNKSSDSIGK
jgi:hypothetical protein